MSLTAWQYGCFCYHVRREWSKALVLAVQAGADWEPTGRISH